MKQQLFRSILSVLCCLFLLPVSGEAERTEPGLFRETVRLEKTEEPESLPLTVQTAGDPGRVLLQVTQETTGQDGRTEENRAFSFRLQVAGDPEGRWFWNLRNREGQILKESGSDGELLTQGEPFTLSPGETIEIDVPAEKEITLTEDHWYYRVQVAEALPESGISGLAAGMETTTDPDTDRVNGATFALRRNAKIVFTNDVEKSTWAEKLSDNLPYILLLAFYLAALLAVSLIRRAQDRRKTAG